MKVGTRAKRNMAIAVLIVVSSLFYIAPEEIPFRISTAVIFFPILLITVDYKYRHCDVGITVATFVLCARLLQNSHLGLVESLKASLPGALFYVFYEIIFRFFYKQKSFKKLDFIYLALCDFLSNIVELLIFSLLHFSNSINLQVLRVIILTAIIRSIVVTLYIRLVRAYNSVQELKQQKARYQQLFINVASLKTESYFLKKSSEETEMVMTKSFALYEKLLTEADYLAPLSLEITKDIHEIKKDQLRVLKGLEVFLGEQLDIKTVKMWDVLEIIKDSTKKNAFNTQIKVETFLEKDFVTKEHFRILSILRNLTNNALESILNPQQENKIAVSVTFSEENVIFTVEDTGAGISEKDFAKVFNVGYSTKYDKETGNINRGLGLVIVNDLAKEIGGTVDLKSVKNVGTTFTVLLPKNEIMEGKP